jgi:pSer/pThr/pTyr-binding forkhead associated (FHA) protein
MSVKRVIDKTIVDKAWSPALQGADAKPAESPGIGGSLAATKRFSSAARPPVPRLCVLDDDSDHAGEWFRLRERSTTIGRLEGAIRISHDPDISGKHARIDRLTNLGQSSWVLIDESSTNGTFVRIEQFGLDEDTEIRLGTYLYHWSFANLTTAMDAQLRALDQPACIWKFNRPTVYVLGRSNDCDHCLLADPCLDESHASVSYSPSTGWTIRDLKSLNGIWIRVKEWPLIDGSQFMLGGQRFMFILN